MKNKILLAIADGVGDRPVPELNMLTPLSYAKTPTLDLLAKNGSCGIMDLHGAGVPVGTDLGHMILFGYKLSDYPGRGPIEAFGEGISLKAGDVAFRCNFSTVDDNMNVIDRRAGRIREGTQELAKAVSGMSIDGVEVLLKEATEHRAVLVLRGNGLSAAVSDTDPKVEGKPVKPCVPKEETREADYTARLLNKILPEIHHVLKNHPLNIRRQKEGKAPANFLLTRGAGKMPKLEKTMERLHVSGACVAAESTVLGVARLAGLTPLTSPTFTGNIDTDIAGKASMAAKALKDYDFVVLHMKATDLFGHDNNPAGKVRAIERFDQMVEIAMRQIADTIEDNVIVALAADHSTPCERREHSGDPVPVVISGINIRKDRVEAFDEVSCAEGCLCRIKGNDFFNILMDYLEATPKEGN